MSKIVPQIWPFKVKKLLFAIQSTYIPFEAEVAENFLNGLWIMYVVVDLKRR